MYGSKYVIKNMSPFITMAEKHDKEILIHIELQMPWPECSCIHVSRCFGACKACICVKTVLSWGFSQRFCYKVSLCCCSAWNKLTELLSKRQIWRDIIYYEIKKFCMFILQTNLVCKIEHAVSDSFLESGQCAFII